MTITTNVILQDGKIPLTVVGTDNYYYSPTDTDCVMVCPAAYTGGFITEIRLPDPATVQLGRTIVVTHAGNQDYVYVWGYGTAKEYLLYQYQSIILICTGYNWVSINEWINTVLL